MPDVPIVLSPYTKFRVQVALQERRIRRADYYNYALAITLTDGTRLILENEHETIIALRCLTSGAHAGMSANDARAAEREATMKAQGART